MPGRLPIRMLHDRLLVSLDAEVGDRRSTGGILIPATAALGKRLSWAKVEAVGSQVRSVEIGDRVLHASFGMGTVLAVHGVGDATKADVDFGAAGTKRLSLKHAPMEKL